ncbi:MAG: Sir2 family NAD-dependent protein deacetylase [Betaproteobacteria bacterium]|nr:Sir2 family NAD-dependent protein deacetylase [Betaproteobacteria bacterium]
MTSTATIESVRAWVNAARRVVVLTGAGISTDSGIPDFRGPNGVWTRNPAAERLSDIRHYTADPEVRKASWRARIEHPAWSAAPNAGHHALVALERRGKLHALITQNIDGLHLRAGNSPHRVIEVHGNLHQAICLACGWKGPMQAVLNRVRLGDADPSCETCGGILKSDTISFGQALVPAVIDRAMQSAQEADLLLAVGTSLKVFPVANAVTTAQAAGARIVIMNAQPTQFDEIADAVLNGSISAELPQVCGE